MVRIVARANAAVSRIYVITAAIPAIIVTLGNVVHVITGGIGFPKWLRAVTVCRQVTSALVNKRISACVRKTVREQAYPLS